MNLFRERVSKEELRTIKAATGLGIAVLQAAIKGPDAGDFVCTAIGTGISVANTTERERYRVNAREDAVWGTVGNVVMVNVLASLVF